MLGPLTRILLHYLTLLRFLVTMIQYRLHSRLGHSMRRNLHNELGSDKVKGVRVSLLAYLYPRRVEPASQREKHGDVSWVVTTLRSPVPPSLHLLALQLKLSAPGLRAPERPPFTHPPFWF